MADPEPIVILEETVRVAVESLPEVERMVLKMRFGLEEEREMTLREIADKLSRSTERIRQIEAKALRKLKSPLRDVRVGYKIRPAGRTIQILEQKWVEEGYAFLTLYGRYRCECKCIFENRIKAIGLFWRHDVDVVCPRCEMGKIRLRAKDILQNNGG